MKKKPIEKFETKIKHLLTDSNIIQKDNKIKIRNKIFLKYDDTNVLYTKRRYYPSKKKDIDKVDFTILIKLNDETIKIFGSNVINPPKAVKLVIDFFKTYVKNEINNIIIGSDIDQINDNTLFITYNLYEIMRKINYEEKLDKNIRFRNRCIPFVNERYNSNIKKSNSKIDYSLILNEFLTSGEYSNSDILLLLNKIKSGEFNKIIIENQISKQTDWFIKTFQNIIDTSPLTKEVARNLGKEYFGFSKIEITGPEHLMEKILTNYGKTIIFGVPYLINTDKYVLSKTGISRSQFDLILINHLADIQIVELKRPDKFVLEFDPYRSKFYPSKDLSIAISQAERYISAVYHDNDDEYLIEGKKIRNFLNDLISGDVSIEICRPTALIILGTSQTITKNFNSLDKQTQLKLSKEDYNTNYLQAYKEIKNAFKNIQITTYSELLDTARLRLHTDEK